MNDKIIPFGKYKGKPVEILASDKEYANWLLAQSWFKEKNINLYNVVINNFREPDNTPEHNKMQIKFLNLDYRLKFAHYINKDFFKFNCEYINLKIRELLSTHKHKNEIAFAIYNSKKDDFLGIKTRELLTYSNPNFEMIDVSYSLKYGCEIYFKKYNGKNIETLILLNEKYFEIEIKPTISDDFPSVLRQMKASMPQYTSFVNDNYRSSILLIRQYTGVGATQDEFIEYFKTQGYQVVFESEIENFEVPNYDRQLVLEQETKDIILNLIK